MSYISGFEGRPLGWGSSYKAGGKTDFADDSLLGRKPPENKRIPNDGRNSNKVGGNIVQGVQSQSVKSILERTGQDVRAEFEHLEASRASMARILKMQADEHTEPNIAPTSSTPSTRTSSSASLGKIPGDVRNPPVQNPPPVPLDEGIVTSRTSLGAVSAVAGSQHTVHVHQRACGRDKVVGFGTPAGVNYQTIGGEVMLLTGEDIKQMVISDDIAARTLRPTTYNGTDKILFELNQNVEHHIKINKYVYFELDLKRKPLEAVPYRSLHISLTAHFGEPELYASMSESIPYPNADEYQWTSEDGTSLIILPVDEEYLETQCKKIVIAVRGAHGVLHFNMRAFTQSYLTGIQHLLRERSELGPAEMQRQRREVNKIKRSIAVSNTRKQRASIGLQPPSKKDEKHLSLSSQSMSHVSESSYKPMTVSEALSKIASRKPVVIEVGLADTIRTIGDEVEMYASTLTHGAPNSADGQTGLSASLLRTLGEEGNGRHRRQRRFSACEPDLKPDVVADHGKHANETGDADKTLSGGVGAHGQKSADRLGQKEVQLHKAHEPEQDDAVGDDDDDASRGSGEDEASLKDILAADETKLMRVLFDNTKDNVLVPSATPVTETKPSSETSVPVDKHAWLKSGNFVTGDTKGSKGSNKNVKGSAKGIGDSLAGGSGRNLHFQQEVGVNVPAMVALVRNLKLMQGINQISKRVVNHICRAIFRERNTNTRPADMYIVLNFTEFRKAFKQITDILGQPLYEAAARPAFMDKRLWDKCIEQNRPEKRLARITQHPDFKRKIIRAFGLYDRNHDGSLTKEEFISLCKNDLGMTRDDAWELFLKGDAGEKRQAIDLQTFARKFNMQEDNNALEDPRDTPVVRESALERNYKRQIALEASYTITISDIIKKRHQLKGYQQNVLATSSGSTVIKSGWLARQNTTEKPTEKGADHKSACLPRPWVPVFCVLERLVGGAVMRVYNEYANPEEIPLPPADMSLFLDGTNPVVIVPGDDHTRAHEVMPSPRLTKLRPTSAAPIVKIPAGSPQTRNKASKKLSLHAHARRPSSVSAVRATGSPQKHPTSTLVHKQRPASAALTRTFSSSVEEVAEDFMAGIASASGGRLSRAPSAERAPSVHSTTPSRTPSADGGGPLSRTPSDKRAPSVHSTIPSRTPSVDSASRTLATSLRTLGGTVGARTPTGSFQTPSVERMLVRTPLTPLTASARGGSIMPHAGSDGGWQILRLRCIDGTEVQLKARGPAAAQCARAWGDAVRASVTQQQLEERVCEDEFMKLRTEAVHALSGQEAELAEDLGRELAKVVLAKGLAARVLKGASWRRLGDSVGTAQVGMKNSLKEVFGDESKDEIDYGDREYWKEALQGLEEEQWEALFPTRSRFAELEVAAARAEAARLEALERSRRKAKPPVWGDGTFGVHGDYLVHVLNPACIIVPIVNAQGDVNFDGPQEVVEGLERPESDASARTAGSGNSESFQSLRSTRDTRRMTAKGRPDSDALKTPGTTMPGATSMSSTRASSTDSITIKPPSKHGHGTFDLLRGSSDHESDGKQVASTGKASKSLRFTDSVEV